MMWEPMLAAWDDGVFTVMSPAFPLPWLGLYTTLMYVPPLPRKQTWPWLCIVILTCKCNTNTCITCTQVVTQTGGGEATRARWDDRGSGRRHCGDGELGCSGEWPRCTKVAEVAKVHQAWLATPRRTRRERRVSTLLFTTKCYYPVYLLIGTVIPCVPCVPCVPRVQPTGPVLSRNLKRRLLRVAFTRFSRESIVVPPGSVPVDLRLSESEI